MKVGIDKESVRTHRLSNYFLFADEVIGQPLVTVTFKNACIFYVKIYPNKKNSHNPNNLIFSLGDLKFHKY